uniref:RanBP2-type domain-containing protein n=1 Tax=Panagrolaimus davidi TaxID=227884 RepID=A0A914Q7R4_9BILA
MEFLPALLHGPASGKIKYLQAKQWEEFSEQLVIIMEKVKNAECSKLMLQQAKQDDQTIMEYGNKMDNLSKTASTMFDQMSLVSGQQRDNWRLDKYGGNHFRTPNWNCKCGYLNYGFRKQCNSCRTFRNGGTSNGFNNRGNSNNRGGGNYNNRGNFNRGCVKLGNRGNNNGRGNLNNCGQQQQQGQQNKTKISNQQQKRHQRSHSDPTTKATAKENKKKPEKNGEATVDSEKEEPAFYLD